ncbi:formyl transferase [Rhodohalobacter sulfatireducens]|uniref:phosphoribosylglycinamide formyltransferase 1 n=1 Tax=Rhodohalobacter sulfatireducens TaxID=2911366 RepID=A0ABS9KIZ5_9BACT|nr:formyl transferase [Rhodohalobacter sulfatireducens]
MLLITSNKLRHKYVANKIASQLDLTAIISEEKAASTTPSREKNNRETKIIQKHFDERSSTEKKLLGQVDSFPKSIEIQKVERGQSNSENVLEWIQSQKPNVILLYGSGIIKAPLLDYYKNRIINLHLGLSPYYRGSGTNFWPLVDGNPECVGATIHIATPDVDAGGILSQVRPREICRSDRAHDLGTKTIITGSDMLCKVVPFYMKNKLQPVKQDLNKGKVFKRKDFNAGAVKKMWQNLESGMIEDYIKNKQKRDSKYPIVSPNL